MIQAISRPIKWFMTLLVFSILAIFFGLSLIGSETSAHPVHAQGQTFEADFKVSDFAEGFTTSEHTWRGYAFTVERELTVTHLIGGAGAECATGGFRGGIFRVSWDDDNVGVGNPTAEELLAEAIFNPSRQPGLPPQEEKAAFTNPVTLKEGTSYMIAQGRVSSGLNCHYSAENMVDRVAIEQQPVIGNWFPANSQAFDFGVANATADALVGQKVHVTLPRAPLLGFTYETPVQPPSVTTTGATLQSNTALSVDLALDDAGAASGADVTRVYLEHGPSSDLSEGTSQVSVATITGPATDQTYSIDLTGRTPDETLYFRILALNEGGRSEGDIEEIRLAAPDAPSDVAADVGSGVATLSWGLPPPRSLTPVTDFVVTVAPNPRTGVGEAVHELDGDAGEFHATGLGTTREYTFTVAARNVAGWGTSSDPITVVADGSDDGGGGGGGNGGGGEKPDPVASGRFGGEDRIATAVMLSETFAAAEHVVLARSDAYADALAGAPLAGSLNAPLLLNPSGNLASEVAEEIERLGATHVHLLGGPVALSTDVEDALAARGLDVTRYAGPNRFSTAEIIAHSLPLPSRRAFIVEGSNSNPRRGWPDAVSVSALAAYTESPILAVTTDAIPPATSRALEELPIDRVTVVGGEAAVSQRVAQDVARLANAPVERLAGNDRYATSAEVADASAAEGLQVTRTWTATGARFPDALAVGPVAGSPHGTGHAGALLLVDGERFNLNDPSGRWLTAQRAAIGEVRAVGGEAVISAGTLAALREAVGM